MTAFKTELATLRQQLTTIRDRHFVAALKSGTEIEDMSYEEIAALREISRDEKGTPIVPLVIKIGGPEARNDIRQCLRIGVDVLLAPMVESVYALTNFVETAQQLIYEEGVNAGLAMNLETITAVQNLDLMIESRAFAALQQVTIGRGDLSKSMHLSVDDEEVLVLTAGALRRIRNQKILTSVGGGLTLNNIQIMARRLPSNRFNTRHVAISNTAEFRLNAADHLLAALEFECTMYRYLATKFSERKAYYEKRAAVLAERMQYFSVMETSMRRA